MRTFPLALAAALLALVARGAPAPLPKPDPSKAELRKLQGEWVSVSFHRGGVPEEVDPSASRMVIAGDRMTYGEGRGAQTFLITLDARKRPKVFHTRGTKELARSTTRGVYRLDGDTLTRCFVGSGKDEDRPTDFSGARPGHIRRVYKRLKKR
jgi:uncharacterized protein (TIGR03067 family)